MPADDGRADGDRSTLLISVMRGQGDIDGQCAGGVQHDEQRQEDEQKIVERFHSHS